MEKKIKVKSEKLEIKSSAKKSTVVKKPKLSIPTPEEMLEAGVHFGHQVRRWHPSMALYIFGKKSNIHIMDLFITEQKLQEACEFLYQTAKEGKPILFVGTKRQAQDIIKDAAGKSGAFCMSNRWIGGTLTNFSEIKKNIVRLKDLIRQRKEGAFSHYTKKEQLLLDREIKKLEFMVGGIFDMKEVPAAVFIVDVKKEKTAYREAVRTGVKIVSLSDTNNDISNVDYPIPGNDDAINAISLIVKTVASAVELGYNENVKTQKNSNLTKESLRQLAGKLLR
ncbi:30S ribosomal protein S2 [Patescibacteria group bacterium]|nr:30S ribosomal protein S2 [Patescibacteria group bacterium]